MTESLDEAFEQATRLPEEEQDALAKWLLAEIASRARWDEVFARSTETLSDLSEKASRDLSAGETEPLDPDSL